MWPHHPTHGTNYPPLPLFEGDEVVRRMPDQSQLTRLYTERAVRFIEQNKGRRFFLYLPHNMPHVPLFVSKKFEGKSGAGLHGDVLMEIDWSVGEILRTLKYYGLDRRTLVIFTSDNGPWLLYGNHAGSAGPFREGKATVFEGGVRVPFLARWPGQIPAGTVCQELATTMDLLPTLAGLARADLPRDRLIDGKDIWPLMSGRPGARSPHEAFFYYWGEELQAVRSGPWKLHFAHSYPSPDPPGADGQPGKVATRQIGQELFNLEADLGETTNLADKHPDVVRHLQMLAEKCREDLGDAAIKRAAKNARAPAVWSGRD
jgi:arylsulfatase A-like enzyme